MLLQVGAVEWSLDGRRWHPAERPGPLPVPRRGGGRSPAGLCSSCMLCRSGCVLRRSACALCVGSVLRSATHAPLRVKPARAAAAAAAASLPPSLPY